MSTKESKCQENGASATASPVLSPKTKETKVPCSIGCIADVQQSPGQCLSSVRHRSRNAAAFQAHHPGLDRLMPPLHCSPPGSDSSIEPDLLCSVDPVPAPTSRRPSTPCSSTRLRKSWKDSDEVALAAQLSLPQLYNDDDFSSSSWASSAAIISTSATAMAAALCDSSGDGIRISKQSIGWYLKRLLGVLILIFVSFMAGIQTERYKSRKLLEGQHTRDELLINQEQLLIDLVAKTMSSSSSASSPGLPDSTTSTNNNKNQEHSTEFLQHLDLLQKELKEKTEALEQESKLRREAEVEAKEAWGSYQLFTAQLKGASKEEHADLAKLMWTLSLQHFGHGPHYVQFDLSIRQQEGQQAQEAFFTVEMASVEYMPVSVFYFLKQVEAGLWDETSFGINDPYTITAQPTAAHGTNNRLASMTSMGLAYLPFLEHSDKVPHQAYTLGFSGKDHRGPDFFVNKVDNSKNHVVTGQPCFGTVIIGRETVDLMGQLQGPPADPYFIDQVDIVSVSIVKDLKDVVGGPEYLVALNQEEREEI